MHDSETLHQRTVVASSTFCRPRFYSRVEFSPSVSPTQKEMKPKVNIEGFKAEVYRTLGTLSKLSPELRDKLYETMHQREAGLNTPCPVCEARREKEGLDCHNCPVYDLCNQWSYSKALTEWFIQEVRNRLWHLKMEKQTRNIKAGIVRDDIDEGTSNR